MSTAREFMFCATMFLCVVAEALAHADRPNMNGTSFPSRVYGGVTACTPSNRIDLSRLQRGELAIMVQERGFRESNASPFDAGECW
jgi:hypothetical protein